MKTSGRRQETRRRDEKSVTGYQNTIHKSLAFRTQSDKMIVKLAAPKMGAFIVNNLNSADAALFF
jgi:hypothetical protein